MKAAIITGASVGIGSATAAAFTGAGFTVYNLSRRQCPVDGVTNLPTDLSSDDAIAVLTELVNMDDVLMPDACDDSSFVEEHVHEVLLTGEVREDALNDDWALESTGTHQASQKHLRHAPCGESAVDDVIA